MQAYDDAKLIEAFSGNIKDLERRRDELLSSGKANRVVIGKLPQKGDSVELNGLSFHVFSATDEGTVVLKLDRP